jgi:hypothetical protein
MPSRPELASRIHSGAEVRILRVLVFDSLGSATLAFCGERTQPYDRSSADLHKLANCISSKLETGLPSMPSAYIEPLLPTSHLLFTTLKMSVAVLLSQLRGLLVKLEQLQPRFRKVYPNDAQWDILTDLGLGISHAAKNVENEIRTLKESRSERAWEESKEFRSNAQSSRGDLFAKGRLKNSHIFRRNIITIFGGPKDSKFDSDDMKTRKESTRERCEFIRGLSADGVISWAIAYPPTLWAAGSMASDVFTCLLDDIEPELVQTWPPTVRETLHLLKADEGSLNSSLVYDEFLQGLVPKLLQIV